MRYAAKLLFQFRVAFDGTLGIVRTVEERTILISARSAQLALKKALRYGRDGRVSYENNDGNRVLVEFVGVRDLMHLGPECDAATVWYEIRTMRRPLERRRQLIPQPAKLSAIRLEKNARRSHRRVSAG
jgi:hypothetical protein